MRHIIALCIHCFPANATADSRKNQLKNLLAEPCAVEIDISEMHDHAEDFMPIAITGFLPTSMHYRQINAAVFRIDGKGSECGDYVRKWFGDPKSFDGLKIRKIVSESDANLAK